MMKIKQNIYHIVKYDDISFDNRIWGSYDTLEEAEKVMNYIIATHKDILKEVWVESVVETVTKDIKLHKKIIVER